MRFIGSLGPKLSSGDGEDSNLHFVGFVIEVAQFCGKYSQRDIPTCTCSKPASISQHDFIKTRLQVISNASAHHVSVIPEKWKFIP